MLGNSVICRPLIAEGFNHYIMLNTSAHVTLRHEPSDMLTLREVYEAQKIE
jgi:hypothetical protein